MGRSVLAAIPFEFCTASQPVTAPCNDNDGGNMQHRSLFVSLLIAGQIGLAAPAQAQFVAGVDPSVRPEGAPVITENFKDGEWYIRALFGVTAPYPSSLKFLEDQGAWFNPFTRPGMTGPYDIRGWHQEE